MFLEAGYGIQKIAGINRTKKIVPKLLAVLSLGWLEDMQYPQFACVAKPREID